MKKNIFLILLSMLLVAAMAAPVMAEDCNVDGSFKPCDTIPDATGGAADLTNLAFSPNVTFAYLSDGNAYSMGTFNTKGTKTYGAASPYSGLYQTSADSTTATAIETDLSAATWDSTVWVPVAK